MKRCCLKLGLVSALVMKTALAASTTNEASAAAGNAIVAPPVPAPQVSIKLGDMLSAMQQLRDIEQRKTTALANIPGMRQLDAQIAELSTRLCAAEEARRLLITSNRMVVASFAQEADQVRTALKRREDPQIAALLQQKMAQIQTQKMTNLTPVSPPVALPGVQP